MTAILFLAAVHASPAAPPAGAKARAACPPPAAQPTAAELQRAAKQARDRGFLWRISKGGHSSYLYGTLHLGSLGTALPGPAVKDALGLSDVLALELDLLDPDIQSRLARSLQGTGEAVPLPATLSARLRAQLAAACLTGSSAQSMPPMLQLTSLSALAARRDGLDPSFGIDAILASAAHVGGQPVVSLESPEMQVSLLTDFSADEERQMLAQGLADLESGRTRRLLKRTASIWANSRLADLEAYPQWCECLRDENERSMMKRVLDDRNVAMAERVAQLHDEGQRVFVAVGSLHMIGAVGLPSLLRAQGFEIERITPR